jgi:glutamine cyclotransferase
MQLTGSVSRERLAVVVIAAVCLGGWIATNGRNAPPSVLSTATDGGNPQSMPVLGAEVIKSYPHDPHAFTQGLEYYDGHLYESTGRSGQSTLRRSLLETGAVLNQVSLPSEYFGEGLTIFRGKIYQLTWLSKTGFIYDVRTFRRVGEFHYESEGWGLTHDDASLILSDGSNKLQFIDPASFKTVRTLEVYAGSVAITNLNELGSSAGMDRSSIRRSKEQTRARRCAERNRVRRQAAQIVRNRQGLGRSARNQDRHQAERAITRQFYQLTKPT